MNLFVIIANKHDDLAFKIQPGTFHRVEDARKEADAVAAKGFKHVRVCPANVNYGAPVYAVRGSKGVVSKVAEKIAGKK